MTSAGVTPDDDRERRAREEEISRRNREADDAWEDYIRSGWFADNGAVMAWLDTWGTARERLCWVKDTIAGGQKASGRRLRDPPFRPTIRGGGTGGLKDAEAYDELLSRNRLSGWMTPLARPRALALVFRCGKRRAFLLRVALAVPRLLPGL